jgi:hypothetical protein
MPSLLINPPFTTYTDLNGEPLEAGYIYIGTSGLEPSTNPINVYWDQAQLYPAAQPIRTIAGSPSRDGSPAVLYIESAAYSIKVEDKNNNLVYSRTTVPIEPITPDSIAESDVDEFGAKLGINQWIIVGSETNADYTTLVAYEADAPSVGDQVLCNESQTVTSQLIMPSGITLRFKDGANLLCATNIATSVIQFGSDIHIEGVLSLVLSHTGTTAKAVEFNGDNVTGRINIENSSTGTLTTGYHINANKTGNQITGFIDNTGGGTLTNVRVDNSTEDSNALLIIDGVNNQPVRTAAARVFRDGLEFDLGSDANGDTYYRSSGVLTRLPIGSEGNVLKINSSLPVWDTPFALNWAHPSQIGSDLNIAGISSVAITAMNNTDIAFIDYQLDSLRCYRFGGSAWAIVGSGFTITLGAGEVSALTRLTDSNIAFVSSIIKELRAYTFNGSVWSLVGSALSITMSSTPSLATLSSTNVALSDANSIRTFTFNGSTWSQVGNTLSISGGPTSTITALNSNTIAYIDPSSDDLRTYSFDGTDWSLVGNELNISGLGGNPSITALNDKDIILIDDTANIMRMYRWDGTDWSALSGTSFTVAGGGDAAMTALNGQDIAYIDVVNEDLRKYRFPFSLSVPHQISA